MRWAKPGLRNSFFGWLGKSPDPSAHAEQLEEIRAAMLHTFHTQAAGEHAELLHRLRFSRDIAGLWYARSALMQAISASHGEAQARRELVALTELFEGAEPGGGTSRPSPLSVH